MIDLSVLPIFFVTVMVLFITPGPDMAFLVATGVSQGRKPAFFASLGVTLAMFIHGIAAAVGLSAIIATFPIAFDIIRYAGVAYLVWLAIKSIQSKDTHHEAVPTIKSPLENFRRGFFTNLLNPKAILFEAVFLPQFTNPEFGSIGLQVFILGTLLAVLGFLWNSFLAIASGSASTLLVSNSKFQSFQKWLLGTVYAGLAVRLLVMERTK
jgi:threonine/homoserine/homoserine lactone efflux protein